MDGPTLVSLSVAAVGAGVSAALTVPGVRSLPRPAPSATGPPTQPVDSPVLRLVATASVALGAAFLVGGAPGAMCGLVAAVLCWHVTGRMEPPSTRDRRKRLAASVPHAVDLMAACLAVGLSPAAAVEQLALVVDPPLADELAGLSARLRLGTDPATVWRDLARHPQLGGLGRTVSRAVETGASVADAMLRLSDDLRGRSRADVEARARAVGVQAALPLGVCLLPSFVLIGVVPLVAGSVSVLVQH